MCIRDSSILSSEVEESSSEESSSQTSSKESSSKASSSATVSNQDGYLMLNLVAVSYTHLKIIQAKFFPHLTIDELFATGEHEE